MTEGVPSKRPRVHGVSSARGLWDPKRRNFSTPKNVLKKPTKLVTSTPASIPVTCSSEILSCSDASGAQKTQESLHGLSTDESDIVILNSALNMVDDSKFKSDSDGSNPRYLSEAIDVQDAKEALASSCDSWLASMVNSQHEVVSLGSLARKIILGPSLIPKLCDLAKCVVIECGVITEAKNLHKCLARKSSNAEKSLSCVSSLKSMAKEAILGRSVTPTLQSLAECTMADYVPNLVDFVHLVNSKEKSLSERKSLDPRNSAAAAISKIVSCHTSTPSRKRHRSGSLDSPRIGSVSKRLAGMQVTPATPSQRRQICGRRNSMFSLRSFGVMGAVERGLLEMQIGTPKETARKVLTLSSDSSSLGDSEASQNDPATPPAGAAAASLAPIFMPKSAASSRLPSTKVNHKKHEVKKPKKLSQKLKNPKKNPRTSSQVSVQKQQLLSDFFGSAAAANQVEDEV